MSPDDCKECGSNRTYVNGETCDAQGHNPVDVYYVECRECKHRGPLNLIKEMAIIRYNAIRKELHCVMSGCDKEVMQVKKFRTEDFRGERHYAYSMRCPNCGFQGQWAASKEGAEARYRQTFQGKEIKW